MTWFAPGLANERVLREDIMRNIAKMYLMESVN
jgi:hypothetical protein